MFDAITSLDESSFETSTLFNLLKQGDLGVMAGRCNLAVYGLQLFGEISYFTFQNQKAVTFLSK